MLSTEPHALSANTHHPFYIVVTARILTTPQPESPITLATHLTPFYALWYQSYSNIVRVDSRVTTYPGPHPRVPGILPPDAPWSGGSPFEHTPDDLKVIRLSPRSQVRYIPLQPKLSLARGEVVIIPPPGKGVLSIKLEVPRDKIAGANVKPGERYRVSLTDGFLGTDWFGFGDFRHRKLRCWEPPENQSTIEELEDYLREKGQPVSGVGDWEMGENPKTLNLVIEEDGRAGVVEFDVVE